ncbi:MAG: site-specific integrase [Chloroflexota bacterium]
MPPVIPQKFRNPILPNGETFLPEHLTPTDVREYRQWLVSRQAAPSSVNRRLAALRAYVHWLRGETLDVRSLESQKLAWDQDKAPCLVILLPPTTCVPLPAARLPSATTSALLRHADFSATLLLQKHSPFQDFPMASPGSCDSGIAPLPHPRASQRPLPASPPAAADCPR